MAFRLSALQAGLELTDGTSPPVLRRITGLKPSRYGHLADEAAPGFDVIRSHLRFFGPTRPNDVAKYLDAPLREVKARWPEDVVEVQVTDVAPGSRPATLSLLEADAEDLVGRGPSRPGPLLLGPFDPYLQLRDRELLVPGETERKDLWRTLGRPGAVLVDGEVRGTWRAHTKAKKTVEVTVTPWKKVAAEQRRGVEGEAERLATHRGLDLAGVTWA